MISQASSCVTNTAADPVFVAANHRSALVATALLSAPSRDTAPHKEAGSRLGLRRSNSQTVVRRMHRRPDRSVEAGASGSPDATVWPRSPMSRARCAATGRRVSTAQETRGRS